MRHAAVYTDALPPGAMPTAGQRLTGYRSHRLATVTGPGVHQESDMVLQCAARASPAISDWEEGALSGIL